MGEVKWVLDGGTLDERLAELDEMLKDVELIITKDQEQQLQEYLPGSQPEIDDRNINELIDQLEEKINEVGRNPDGSLNKTGKLMRKLAVELDEQN